MKKLNYSNPFLEAEKMSLPRGLKAQKPGRAVISHAAETSGFRESAESRKPNAVIAGTVILSLLTIM
jgi:hypothetical protein